ncbi:hypothetical protein [Streptomyces sp. bgisy022]|uniref:hypothetical protein n=1 Tax=Streptomyces sp. bgisy022 TaxID=3413769 RepID=UPI003D74C271
MTSQLPFGQRGRRATRPRPRARRRRPLPGVFLTAPGPGGRAAAPADSRRPVEEAATFSADTFGADTLLLVSGGLPPRSRHLRAAHERTADALGGTVRGLTR